MAFSLNQVTILGNLTRDPELRYTPNGNAVTNFSLATNKSYKDKNEEWHEVAEYHNVVIWGKSAEVIVELCKKGDKLLIGWGSVTTSFRSIKEVGWMVIFTYKLHFTFPRDKGYN